jgi:hypothetical protein
MAGRRPGVVNFRQETNMAKKAAILYQGSTFRASAVAAQTFLKQCGFQVVRCLPFNEPSTLDNLPAFPTVDFMVWYAHGGWDGPMVFQDLGTEYPDQISPSEPNEWVRLMTYFKGQLRSRGMFVAHCCQSAGRTYGRGGARRAWASTSRGSGSATLRGP